MVLRFVIIMMVSWGVLACSPGAPQEEPRSPVEVRDTTPAYTLAEPNVVMEADPAPPFTYWAPEGAVIRNHANPGLWIAVVDGRNVKSYFGDQCGASEWQHYVGQTLSVLPPASAGVTVRRYCATCAKTDDLRRDRINVVFSDETQIIEEIACH